MRLLVALISLAIATALNAQQERLPDAPRPSIRLAADRASKLGFSESSSVSDPAELPAMAFFSAMAQTGQFGQITSQNNSNAKPAPNVPVDSNGNPIPLERRQPQRILGFMPNFRSVSGGSKPHPPGWKYNFIVATRQATDYSSFIFLGLTSITAEGMNMHPSLGKGVDGFYAYTWRGFLDKTDGTYLSAWLLPSLLHEDTRFYALGNESSIPARILYVIDRQAITRTYGGRQTPNIAGLGGKILTQVVSRNYYPPSATSFSVLASKFGYSVMRDVIFSSIREFYPDIAAHYIKKHREKIALVKPQRAHLPRLE